MSLTINQIAENLNKFSNEHEIGKLQKIRKNIKNLKNKPLSVIFKSESFIDKDWAFHYGGRKELQFNIGFEPEGLRYGIAISLETSRTLTDIKILFPKIERLNSLIESQPELFTELKMWYWRKKRSEISNVQFIDESLLKNKTFIFIGKIIQKEAIDYHEILSTFDHLLKVYIHVEQESNTKIDLLKTCVLKPIMWNTKDFIEPSGYKSLGGFSKDYGYGHEEWNNNPNWIWRNFKIFHTESKPNLEEYAKEGNLCIVMISSYEKHQYALGIAANVYYNSDSERRIIAKELNIYNNYKQVWQQETVRKAFSNNLEKFIEHWEKNYEWVRWKCPIEYYLWFEKPIRLSPELFSDKGKLISMHGSYQRVLPQHILEAFQDELKENSFILDWLTTGDFDTEWYENKQEIDSGTSLRKKHNIRGANAPASRAFSYWIEGIRNIEPLHAILQSKFVEHLSKREIVFKENDGYIDVHYELNGNIYFCEIKPTKNMPCKIAIRIAIGQLLEYQFHCDKNAKLEIVLGSQPSKKEVEFVKSLGIGLTYFDEINQDFYTF